MKNKQIIIKTNNNKNKINQKIFNDKDFNPAPKDTFSKKKLFISKSLS